jgi:competence protein ComEC
MSTDAEISGSAGQPKRKPRYQPLVLAVIPFAFGIILDRRFDFHWLSWLGLCLVLLLGWWLSTRSFQAKDKARDKAQETNFLWSSILLTAAFISLGGLWHHARWNWYPDNHIACFAAAEPQLCCVRGRLVSEPRTIIRSEAESALDPLQHPVRTRLRLQLYGIRDKVDWVSVAGQVDVFLHEMNGEFRSGDHLQVQGKLFGLKPPTNPGQFDFENYMRSQGRFATIHTYDSHSVQMLDRPDHWAGAQLLSRIRRRLNEVAWRLIDGDEAGFASAILLGNREQLSPNRRAAFLETGTAHLLAISGLHVGILAASIFLLCRLGLVGRRKCLIATIAFVLFYMWLVEFRPTVVRAAILISLFCIGRLAGQRAYSFNLLAASGWIVLLINPSDLFGVGPQLSFLAVATLVFARDWIWWPRSKDPIKQLIASSRPGWLRWVYRLGRSFRATALASALIWVCAAPLVAWHFHLVAPVGLILNPLLMLPIACGLYAGAATLMFGWLSDWPARFFGWVCELALGGIESAIQLAQALPLSHFWSAGPPLWSVIVFYVLLFWCGVHPSTRIPGRWVVGVGLAWLAFGWLLPAQVSTVQRSPVEQSMVCTFADVGHGTSALVQFPNGKNLLYDCGSFSSSRYGLQNVSSVLWTQNIVHLDAVVLSHADVDHFNAMPGICERFSIGVVYVSPQMLNSDSESVAVVKKAIENYGIPLREITSGDETRLNGEPFTIEVLSPSDAEPGSNDNADSLVLRVSSLGRSVLLPGDLEAERLEKLLKLPPVQSDVVMLAHHGSPNSQPRAFIEWCQPEIVVASCGRGRLKQEVETAVAALPCQFFRTDRDGAIRIKMTKSHLDVTTYPAGCWVKSSRRP